MATRAYIRIDPALFIRKAVEQRYPAEALAAYVSILCLAEEQPERGRFRSERLLRLLLDYPTDDYHLAWGKSVAYLIKKGDLVRLPNGSLYVDGWDEWQEGDVTVTERMARLRERKRNAGKRNQSTNGVTPSVTVAVTPDVTPGVTPPVTTHPSEPWRRAESGERIVSTTPSGLVPRARLGAVSDRGSD